MLTNAEVIAAAKEYVEKLTAKLQRDFLAQLEKALQDPQEGYDLLQLYDDSDEQMKKQLIQEDFAAWFELYQEEHFFLTEYNPPSELDPEPDPV